MKKKPGAPSLNKTTLAVLRHNLTVPKTTEKFIKKPQPHYKVVDVTLPVNTVAKWLDVAPDTVRCIERDRPGYRLTEENAEKLAHQTGVNRDWLLANDVSKPVLNWLGGAYTQTDFDERQKSLLRPSPDFDLRQARFRLADYCAKIAAILVRGTELGQPVEYGYRLNKALQSVYFNEAEKPVWPALYLPEMDMAENGRLNFAPLISDFEKDLRKIHRKKVSAECPACLSQGVVACPNCILSVTEVKGKIIKQLLVDEKTGKPVNCKVCKNHRIIPCGKCKGKPAKPPRHSRKPHPKGV